jgi:hypothetical protein
MPRAANVSISEREQSLAGLGGIFAWLNALRQRGDAVPMGDPRRLGLFEFQQAYLALLLTTSHARAGRPAWAPA